MVDDKSGKSGLIFWRNQKAFQTMTIFLDGWNRPNLFLSLYFFLLGNLKSFASTFSCISLILYLPGGSGSSFPCLGLTNNFILFVEEEKYIHYFHNLLGGLASPYSHSHLFAGTYTLLVPFPHSHYYYIADKSLLLVPLYKWLVTKS